MRFLSVILSLSLLNISLTAAVRGDNAMYIGGTITDLKQGQQGEINLDSKYQMEFVTKHSSHAIAYSDITGLEFGEKVGRRVGLTVALAATTLGLAALPVLFSQKKKHFLTINYLENGKDSGVVVLELAKGIVQTAVPVIQARSGKRVVFQGKVTDDDRAAMSEPSGPLTAKVDHAPPTQPAAAIPPQITPLVKADTIMLARFTSTPSGAEVRINGEYAGTTPTAEIRQREGKHRVTVTKSGFITWEGELELMAGDSRVIDAELKPSPVDPSKPKIIGLQ